MYQIKLGGEMGDLMLTGLYDHKIEVTTCLSRHDQKLYPSWRT